MLKIECQPPIEGGICECCGGKTTSLVRFVTESDVAHAAYFARFSDNHPDPHAALLVIIGAWGPSATQRDRDAFALRMWMDAGGPKVGVMNVEFEPWRQTDLANRTMTRQQALTHPLLKRVFNLTDAMVDQDAELTNYLGRNPIESRESHD